jgi:zinc transport system substrate-binding protein
VKKVFIAAILLAAAVGIILMQQRGPTPAPGKELRVAASTFALYDAARKVAGDRAEVYMVVPFGVDIHSFEPSPKTMARIQQSTLFLYSGAGLEPWTKSFARSENALDMSRFAFLRSMEEHDDEDDGHEEHHHHEGVDPHYWLDIGNMITLVNKISEVLAKERPEDAGRFRQNAQRYVRELEALDGEYKERLKNCRQDTIVVNHNAFGYLAERYGFHVEALSGLSPDAMPSAKTMAALIGIVKERKIKTVFFESFVSDRLVKNLADESGTGVDVLQPLANISADEAESGTGYIEIMRQNLQKLSHALECS